MVATYAGLTLGVWFGLRETPVFVGAYGAISPFVRTAGTEGENPDPTYQVGLSAGMYIPLLDFN